MRFRSFTSASKLRWGAFLLAVFLLPYWTGENLLLYRASGRFREVQQLKWERARIAPKEYLLIGDSTARVLHFWNVFGTHTRVNRQNDSWLNLGLGGSTVWEWSVLTERALREVPAIEKIALVAVPNAYANSPAFVDAPYSSYLSSWGDLFSLFTAGDLAAFFQLAGPKLSRLYGERHEILLHYADFPWTERLLFRRVPALSTSRPATSEALEMPYRRILSSARGKKLKLILSPLHSSMRAREDHIAGRAYFRELCRKNALDCSDWLARYPDEAFERDGVHLKSEYHEAFLSSIETLLR